MLRLLHPFLVPRTPLRQLHKLASEKDMKQFIASVPNHLVGVHGTDLDSAKNIEQIGVDQQRPLFFSFSFDVANKYSLGKENPVRLAVLTDPNHVRSHEVWKTLSTTKISNCATIMPGSAAEKYLSSQFTTMTKAGDAVVAKWCLGLASPLLVMLTSEVVSSLSNIPVSAAAADFAGQMM